MSCLPSLDVVVTSERLTGTSAFTSAVNIPGEDRPDPLPVLVPADAVDWIFPPVQANRYRAERVAARGTQPSAWRAPKLHTHPISGQTLTKVRQAAFRFRFPSDFPRGDSRNMPARP